MALARKNRGDPTRLGSGIVDGEGVHSMHESRRNLVVRVRTEIHPVAGPEAARLRIRFVGMAETGCGCVLVLPGGKVHSDRPVRSWQLANVRMAFFAGALRRRLGPDVAVRRVRYRLRGWNSPRLDALRDARAVLNRARDRYEPEQIAVVGHSMGGRVAAHLAAGGDVGTVVALAPWWVGDDSNLIPATTRLLVVHGTADTWTDPGASRVQTERAAHRGLDAQWVGLDGAGHYMVRHWRQWHRLAGDFVAQQFIAANSDT
jgi:pimeloyl-ACP methyl ester carboxylesterase